VITSAIEWASLYAGMAAIVMVMYNQLPLLSKDTNVSINRLSVERLTGISNTVNTFFRVIAPQFLEGF
jgi:hypothetical protein